LKGEGRVEKPLTLGVVEDDSFNTAVLEHAHIGGVDSLPVGRKRQAKRIAAHGTLRRGLGLDEQAEVGWSRA
jgi:hypothetical protein